VTWRAVNVDRQAAAQLATQLRCLITGRGLRMMTPEECAAVNLRIAEGTVFNRLGQRVTQPLEAALISLSRRWAYRIDAGIPQMVSGEALMLTDET
jgi:uncharacterized protein YbaR (Trm112 family)